MSCWYEEKSGRKTSLIWFCSAVVSQTQLGRQQLCAYVASVAYLPVPYPTPQLRCQIELVSANFSEPAGDNQMLRRRYFDFVGLWKVTVNP
jgi:hypothetical protein